MHGGKIDITLVNADQSEGKMLTHPMGIVPATMVNLYVNTVPTMAQELEMVENAALIEIAKVVGVKVNTPSAVAGSVKERYQMVAKQVMGTTIRASRRKEFVVYAAQKLVSVKNVQIIQTAKVIGAMLDSRL